RLRNNIVYQRSSENYLEYWTRSSLVSGSNNLWFGSGRAPSQFSGSVNADPKFADLGAFDFHLQAGSPAAHAGVETGVPTDFYGRPRNHGLRAFEPIDSPPSTTASAPAH